MAGIIFKQALSQRGGGMPEPVDYTPPQEELDIQNQLRQRMTQGPKPQFTPEQIEQRVAQNQREYELGLVALLSGDKTLAGAGGLVLKKSLADRTPVVSERGTTDPLRGTFQYNPDYLQEQYQRQLEASQGRVGAGRERWELARQNAQERALRDQQHMEAMAAIHAAGAGQEKGNFQPDSIAPDGSQVVLNTNNGMRYKVTLGPNGEIVRVPYLGVTTPKAQVEKGVETAGTAAIAAAGAENTRRAVEANPNAFGTGATFVSNTPGLLKGWAAKIAGVSPADLQTRANILKQASKENNELFGAAQSAGELKKAQEFEPSNDDTPELVLSKNAALRNILRQSAKAQGPTVAAIIAARNPALRTVFEDDPQFLAAMDAATPNSQGQVGAVPQPGAATSAPDPLGLRR